MNVIRRSTPQASSPLAYTLIELLLAMVLSTAVLAALWSLLSIYAKLFDTAGVETEQAQLARAMLVMIESDLVNVVPDVEVRKTPGQPQEDTTDAARDGAAAEPGNQAPNGDTSAATSTSSDTVAPARDASEAAADFATSATVRTDVADSIASHLTGVMSGDSQRAAFTQPSLIGDSETLWLVVHRQRDASETQDRESTFTTDTTFEPAAELAVVEYALTYRDATDAIGTTADTTSTLFETDEPTGASGLSDTSAAEDLDGWQAIANSEMETAAAQLGTIDREVIDASRGLERREAPWPVSPLATRLTPASFGAESGENMSDDVEVFADDREFVPPTRVADIHGRATERTSASISGSAPTADAIDFTSLLTAEVVRVRFRYHDGRNWRSQWDSRAQGSLPRAVEIILAVLPTDQVAVDRELARMEENASNGQSAWPVYRHVVALPTTAVDDSQQSIASALDAGAGETAMPAAATGGLRR